MKKKPTKKQWVLVATKIANNAILTQEQKDKTSLFFEPLITHFNSELQNRIANSNSYKNGIIYTKWYRNYFYFCEQYDNDAESKFVRLEFINDDQFSFSYFRHTGQWWLVYENIDLEKCVVEMQGNPNFRPMCF